MKAGANSDSRAHGISGLDELRRFPLPHGAISAGARRSIGVRATTNFPAVIHDGTHVVHCRAVELSASGILVERGRAVAESEAGKLLRLEMFLPEQSRPIRVQARVVRSAETRQALAFVGISDVDRLTLMEHLDRKQRRETH
jgi:hypothetical protein